MPRKGHSSEQDLSKLRQVKVAESVQTVEAPRRLLDGMWVRVLYGHTVPQAFTPIRRDLC